MILTGPSGIKSSLEIDLSCTNKVSKVYTPAVWQHWSWSIRDDSYCMGPKEEQFRTHKTAQFYMINKAILVFDLHFSYDSSTREKPSALLGLFKGAFTRCDMPHAIVILAHENDCRSHYFCLLATAYNKVWHLYTNIYSIPYAKIRIACDMSHRVNRP